MQPESRAALRHALEAAREIQSVAAGKTLSEYEEDKHLRAIVERYFITIGEALGRIARHDEDLFLRIAEARSIVGFPETSWSMATTWLPQSRSGRP